MTESKILELLSENTKSESFQKLSLDCVQHISKNIANMMYNSLSTKGPLNEDKRLNILILLQKWCSNSGSHLKINHNNYDCLIGPLTKVLKSSTFFGDEIQIKLDDYDEACRLNFKDSLFKHYNKLEKINKEKSKFMGIIKNRDRRKCGDNTMFIPNLKCAERFECLLELKRVMDLEGCEDVIPAKILKKSCSPKRNDLFMRQKQIGAGYALLNLNRSNTDMLLLNNILINLASYENLQGYEVTFIEYLWQKCGGENFPSQISLQLLENFSFIYEKVFIKSCTEALQSSAAQEVPVMCEEVQRIIELSSKSDRLHNNIRNLLYELYAYSAFSNKLCCFFTLVK